MAYGVHSKKFLCCLPVRLGVFVLSLVQTVLYALLAFLFWFALIDKGEFLPKFLKQGKIRLTIMICVEQMFILILRRR